MSVTYFPLCVQQIILNKFSLSEVIHFYLFLNYKPMLQGFNSGDHDKYFAPSNIKLVFGICCFRQIGVHSYCSVDSINILVKIIPFLLETSKTKLIPINEIRLGSNCPISIKHYSKGQTPEIN